jgi:hypothetical protein
MSSIRIKKNECQEIMEESAPTQTKEKATSSLRARDVGATATRRSFVHTVRNADDDGTPGPACTLSGNRWDELF